MKKYLIFGIGIISLILFISFISPILITTLSGNSSENLTFSTSTVNYCFQESANVSTSCGGLSTGIYSTNDEFVNPNYIYDGNYSTYAEVYAIGTNSAFFYVNYTKPINSDGMSLWQVAETDYLTYDLIRTNLSIPNSCWTYNESKLILRMFVNISNDDYSWDCYNGSWVNLRKTNGDVWGIVDEAMYWSKGITRNLSISKYVNVTSATINLSGYNRTKQTEESKISADEYYTSPSNANDTNWATYAEIDNAPVGMKYIEENYTISGSFVNLTLNYKFSRYSPSGNTIFLRAQIWNFTLGNWITYLNLGGGIINEIISEGSYSISEDSISNGEIRIRQGGETDPPPANDERVRIYETNVTIQYGSIDNPYISINNTHIWNFTGTFNQTNNKTNDFFSTLNSAINNGKCDCVGCSLVGNNCSLNFTIHSDSNGILQYSDIQINYDPIPFVYLKLPGNATYSSFNKTFTCNSTDEINLKNITLYIWNSTSIYNNSNSVSISGTTNSTIFNVINFSRSDNYTWNCLVFNNNSYSNWYESNYTLYVDISTPITTLNYPTNNLWLNNGTNVNFNCTTEGENLDSQFLYGNFTGTWALNQTKTGITSGVMNNFKLNLSDNSYSWTCGANKSTDSTIVLSQYGNYTVNIDTTFPVGYNMSITTTAGSQTISFLTNISDNNLNICTYTIYDSLGAINGLNNNVSFTCNTLDSATVTAYGTYILSVTSWDKASNSLNQNLSFTTSASVGITVTGGASGTSELKLSDTFFILNTNLQNIIDVKIAVNSVRPREKTILILNKGKDEITLKISCDTKNVNESSRNISVCDYIKFSNETIVVTPNENNPTETTVYIFTPEFSDFNEHYYVSLIAKNEEENSYSKLSLSFDTSYLATIFYKYSYFPFQSDTPDEDKSAYPVFLVSLILSSLLLIGSIALFQRANLLLTGFLVGFVLFFLVFFLLALII